MVFEQSLQQDRNVTAFRRICPILTHMRRSDLIESYYSNLTDQVNTDSNKSLMHISQPHPCGWLIRQLFTQRFTQLKTKAYSARSQGLDSNRASD
jgi:hypothetical protein